MKIHRPKTIDEVIHDLHQFLDSDMWYAFNNEMKSEKDLCDYLDAHFKILHQQIKYVRRKRNNGKTNKRKSK